MSHGTSDLFTSLVTTMTHEARIIRQAGLAYTEARGREGLDVVERALVKHYDWRAAAAAARGTGDLVSVIQSWRSAELLALNGQGWGQLVVGSNGLRLRVESSPELVHYDAHGVRPFAALHYKTMVAAVMRAAGLDDAVTVRWEGAVLDLEAGTLPIADGVTPGIELAQDAGLQMLKATSENRGALLVFLGREAEEAFGADGEEMYRVAVRGFGAERGSAMRLNHLSSGLSLDLQNMLELYDSGGNENVWEYRDEGVLNAEEWSQDCTHCPFVRPWQDLEGLRYGEIYDHEFHYSQFKAYRRDIEVRWGELQSRGDATCEFRFSIKREAVA